MREIKFRAWEKPLKEIIPVFSIDFENRIINTRGLWRFFDEVELMQSTGLKDKNGVYIYEGDILHQEKYPTPDMQIKFITGCFVGVSTNKIQEINWEPSNLTKLQELDYEVIGNIYENPELLEESK